MAQPLLDEQGNVLIDIEAFNANWELIQAKLEKIASLPVLEALEYTGRQFEGYTIEDGIITYKTYTHFNGCGAEYYDFIVNIEDLNQPVEFFEAKFVAELNARRIERERQKQAEKSAQERAELQQLAQLKAKYPNV